MKFKDFKSFLAQGLPDFTLVEAGSDAASDANHGNEQATVYHFVNGVYHCSFLYLYKFDDDDVLVLYYEGGEQSNCAEVEEDNYEAIIDALNDAYLPAKTNILFNDFKLTAKTYNSDFEIEPKGAVQLNGRSFMRYVITITADGKKFSSDSMTPNYIIAVDSENMSMVVKYEDKEVTDENGTKCIYLNVPTIIRVGNYKQVFDYIGNYIEQYIAQQLAWKKQREEEDRKKAEETAKARKAAKLTIEQRKQRAAALWDKYKEEIKGTSVVEDEEGDDIYYDCYVGESMFSTAKDAYEASLVISAYGGMMTDDFEWSQAVMKIVEAIFPEYEFSEACEGLYEVSWKEGETISKDEIEEINDILAHIPHFYRWGGERSWEKQDEGEDEE